MATEHFCLRWNNHQSTLVSVFDNLLESGTLVDCTLAADGRYLKAHKVVLSACSPYLGMLLSQHYDKHPIIILKDVKFEELKAMLDYMYRGEVNISQEQLSTFLKAAETLQIKGLTDAGSDEGNGIQPARPPSSNSTASAIEDPQSPGPPGEGGSSPGPRKRKRNRHGDDGEGDSVSKISLSEGSDRLSGTSVGSPSAKGASVKREVGDGEGDGQMSVDDSGEVVMMSRPGPSNGGTNNKAPWILSADSSGEEMQLTPGQDGQPGAPYGKERETKKETEDISNNLVLEKEDIKQEIKEEVDPLGEQTYSWEKENGSNENQNPGVMFTLVESESELIIPDLLEEQNLLGSESSQNYYEPPAKSVFSTVQRDDSDVNVRDRHRFDRNVSHDYLLVKEESSVKKSIKSTEKPPIIVEEIPETKRSGPRAKFRIHSSPLKFQYPSVTEKENTQTQSQVGLEPSEQSSTSRVSPSPVKSSKIVVDVADAFDKNKVKIQKTKLNFIPKFRKILPAPVSDAGSNSVTNAKSKSHSSQSSSFSSVQTQHTSSPSISNVRNTVGNTCGQQNNTNPQQRQAGLSNSPVNPPVISIPQQIQFGQVGNLNPSQLPMPQQLQGSQMINNTSNLVSIPQHVQPSQVNNSSTAVLSIAPQFSVSPMQPSNLQMQFSNNTNVQTGNFPNTQFFTNAGATQSQGVSYQNGVVTQQAQAVSHPVFVTPNIISSSQTSNQFIAPTAVQYSVSAAQTTPQTGFSVMNSSLENPSPHYSSVTSISTSSSQTPSRKEHSIYVRTPTGFVPSSLSSSGSQTMNMNNTQLVRGRGIYPQSIRRRGRSFTIHHRSPLLPKPSTMLPKK